MNGSDKAYGRLISVTDRACVVSTVPQMLGLALVVGGLALHSSDLTTIGLALFVLASLCLLGLLFLVTRDAPNREMGKKP